MKISKYLKFLFVFFIFLISLICVPVLADEDTVANGSETKEEKEKKAQEEAKRKKQEKKPSLFHQAVRAVTKISVKRNVSRNISFQWALMKTEYILKINPSIPMRISNFRLRLSKRTVLMKIWQSLQTVSMKCGRQLLPNVWDIHAVRFLPRLRQDMFPHLLPVKSSH